MSFSASLIPVERLWRGTNAGKCIQTTECTAVNLHAVGFIHKQFMQRAIKLILCRSPNISKGICLGGANRTGKSFILHVLLPIYRLHFILILNWKLLDFEMFNVRLHIDLFLQGGAKGNWGAKCNDNLTSLQL